MAATHLRAANNEGESQSAEITTAEDLAPIRPKRTYRPCLSAPTVGCSQGIRCRSRPGRAYLPTGAARAPEPMS